MWVPACKWVCACMHGHFQKKEYYSSVKAIQRTPVRSYGI